MTRRRVKPFIKPAVLALVAIAVLAYMISTCSWFDAPTPDPDPDVDQGKLVRLTYTGGSEENPAWSPRGDKIAFQCLPDYSGIWPFSLYLSEHVGREVRNWPTSYSTSLRIPGEVGDWPQTSLAPVSHICVMNADGSGRVKLTDGVYQQDPAWSPDGSKITFAEYPHIYVMNADGSDITPIDHDEFQDEDPTWSPDGNWIAYTSWRDTGKRIFVMSVDGSYRRPLVDSPQDQYDPAWSPDGNRIAFVSYQDERWGIYLTNADGTETSMLDSSSTRVQSPAWSPDGNRIAFSMDWGQSTKREVFVINVDGSGLQRLTNRKGDDADPTWSPDGRRLAFTSSHDYGTPGLFDVYVMVNVPTRYNPLTVNDFADTDPAWSPDGARIAFVSDRDGDDEIYVMKADGSEVAQLTDNDYRDYSPTWSPDGSRIAYTSLRHHRYSDIFIIDDDGSGLVQLTACAESETAHSCEAPSWSPDGARIAYVSILEERVPDTSNSTSYGIRTHPHRHITNTVGTQRITLDLENCSRYGPATWSPDGTQLAFTCKEVHILNLADGVENSLKACEYDPSAPAWSPDGTRIAIRCGYDIYTISVHDDQLTPLNIEIGHNTDPTWSPDGTKLAFATNRDGDYEIYVLDLERAP